MSLFLKPVSTVVSLSALMLLSACGDKKSDSTPAAGSELNGTWKSTCYGPAQNGLYSITTITYSNLALTGNYMEYSDSTCATKVHSSDWTGTSVISGTTATGETKVDISFSSFKSTALTADNATQNNSYKYCGFTDWAVNTQKDVLGKECQGFSIPLNGKSLDIYKVEGTGIKFGYPQAKIGTTLTEADRPTALAQYPLTKQ